MRTNQAKSERATGPSMSIVTRGQGRSWRWHVEDRCTGAIMDQGHARSQREARRAGRDAKWAIVRRYEKKC